MSTVPAKKRPRWGPADFRKFIEAERPGGCQTPIHVLRHLLKGTDGWEALEELIRGKPGNPTGANQHTAQAEGNRDVITVSSDTRSTDESEPSEEQEATPKRDYSREAPTGTSVSYALRRLQRSRPDLYERVKDGGMSANAAMIEAGFREIHRGGPTGHLSQSPSIYHVCHCGRSGRRMCSSSQSGKGTARRRPSGSLKPQRIRWWLQQRRPGRPAAMEQEPAFACPCHGSAPATTSGASGSDGTRWSHEESTGNLIMVVNNQQRRPGTGGEFRGMVCSGGNTVLPPATTSGRVGQ